MEWSLVPPPCPQVERRPRRRAPGVGRLALQLLDRLGGQGVARDPPAAAADLLEHDPGHRAQALALDGDHRVGQVERMMCCFCSASKTPSIILTVIIGMVDAAPSDSVWGDRGVPQLESRRARPGARPSALPRSRGAGTEMSRSQDAADQARAVPDSPRWTAGLLEREASWRRCMRAAGAAADGRGSVSWSWPARPGSASRARACLRGHAAQRNALARRLVRRSRHGPGARAAA
jgi:hypothetical protein